VHTIKSFNLRLIVIGLSFVMLQSTYAHDVGEKIEVECSHDYYEVYDTPYSNVYFAFSLNNLNAHLELGAEGTINAVAEIKSDSGKIFKQTGEFKYTYDSANGLNFPLLGFRKPQSQIQIGDKLEKGVEFKKEFGNFPNVTCYFLK
jgi:hypothetical protein